MDVLTVDISTDLRAGPVRFLDRFVLMRYVPLSYEPVHEISNSVVCATSKGSDQPAHMRSLIRACARRLSIL